MGTNASIQPHQGVWEMSLIHSLSSLWSAGDKVNKAVCHMPRAQSGFHMFSCSSSITASVQSVLYFGLSDCSTESEHDQWRVLLLVFFGCTSLLVLLACSSHVILSAEKSTARMRATCTEVHLSSTRPDADQKRTSQRLAGQNSVDRIVDLRAHHNDLSC